MRLENRLKLQRIKKISGILRVLCVLFMLWCVMTYVMWMMGPIFRHGRWWGNGDVRYTYEGIEFKVYVLSLRERVVAAVFFALTWGSALLCGFQLNRLLGFYSRGEIFTGESAGQIRRWGFACILWGGVEFAWLLIPVIAANAHGRGAGGLGLIVNGLAIVGISWFMEMAAEMREENELTV